MGPGTAGNGDGFLLYPRRPQDPADRFYESVRWEVLRDSMEDYEYFWLLQSRLKAAEQGGRARPAALAQARAALAGGEGGSGPAHLQPGAGRLRPRSPPRRPCHRSPAPGSLSGRHRGVVGGGPSWGRPPPAVGERRERSRKGHPEMRYHVLGAVVAIAMGVSTMESKAEPVVWTAQATVKVFRDTPPDSERALALQAARNEYECGQVILRAGETPLRDVRVKVSSLKGPNGRAIAANRIECRLVGYVLVQHENRYWPDPLPPLRPFTVAAGENQPVWVSVRVPKNAPAGRYDGSLTLTPEGGKALRVPLSLEVWDFAVPDKPSCETAFGISHDYVLEQEGLQAGTPEAEAMLRRYYWYLVEHRLSPYSIPVDVLSDEAGEYLDDPRVTSFILPYSDDAERCAGGWSGRGAGLAGEGLLLSVGRAGEPGAVQHAEAPGREDPQRSPGRAHCLALLPQPGV